MELPEDPKPWHIVVSRTPFVPRPGLHQPRCRALNYLVTERLADLLQPPEINAAQASWRAQHRVEQLMRQLEQQARAGPTVVPLLLAPVGHPLRCRCCSLGDVSHRRAYTHHLASHCAQLSVILPLLPDVFAFLTSQALSLLPRPCGLGAGKLHRLIDGPSVRPITPVIVSLLKVYM